MGRPKGGNNQRRSCGEKAKLIEEYYASGMGYKAFAKEHGISHSLFYSWIKKYDEGGINSLRYKSRKKENIDLTEDEILKLKMIIAEQQIEICRLKEMIIQEE